MKRAIHAGGSLWALVLTMPGGALAQSTQPVPSGSIPHPNIMASPSGRQEATQTDSLKIQDIIVTAQRYATRLQETPVAVSAFNADALTSKGIRNLLDVGNVTPGLSIGSRSLRGGSAGGFTIRGIGVDATVSSPAVGLYIDDVYYPSQVGNLLGLFDVAQVQVLRGPQGTLFGRNTIAGAVLYSTAKPEYELSGYATGQIGDFDRRLASGVINVPLGETIAVRGGFQYSHIGGYARDELNSVDRGSDTTKQGRVQLRFTPSPSLTIDLKGEIVDEHNNGRAIEVAGINPNAQFVGIAAGRLGPFGPPVGVGEQRPLNASYISTRPYRFAGFNAPDFATINYKSVQGVLAYNFAPDWDVKLISSYSRTHTNQYADLDNSPLAIIGGTFGERTTRLFTQEGQIHGNLLDDHVSLTLGSYYYDSREADGGFSTSFGFGPELPSNGATQLHTQTVAVYGQANIRVTQALSFDLGLRYSHEKQLARHVQFPFPPSRASFGDVSPLIGVNLKASDQAFFYAKASKGFRAGGFTLDAQLPGGAQAFDPETAWTYEIGGRFKFWNDRVQVYPTAYYTDWKSIQFNVLQVVGSNTAPATANAGSAQLKGIELETQLTVVRGLSLTASGAYQDGHYTSIDPRVLRTIFPLGFPGPATILPNLTLNDDLQRMPKFKYSVGADYTHHFAVGSTASASIVYSWTGRQRSGVTISDFVILPSYGLLNLRLQWISPDKRFTIAGFVENLTNKHYYIGGIDGAKGYTFGTTEFDVARPRSVGAELRIAFGR